MNKPTSNDPKRPLKLSRQTLRVLGTAELSLAAGGRARDDSSYIGYAPGTAAEIC
jgi:hypothetical protein